MNARELARLYRHGRTMVAGNSLLIDLGEQGGVVFKRTGAALDALDHRARYAPCPLTQADLFALAGVAASYNALVWKSAPVRDAIVARLREHHDDRDPEAVRSEGYVPYQAAFEARDDAAERLRERARRVLLAAAERPRMHAATPAELAAHLLGVLVGASGDSRRVVELWSSGLPSPPRFDDFEAACRHALRVCDALWPAGEAG